MSAMKQSQINDITPFDAWWYEKVINKNLQVKIKNLQIKDAGLFSAYRLLLPPDFNPLTQLCVKSTKSITMYKSLEKTTMNKNNALYV